MHRDRPRPGDAWCYSAAAGACAAARDDAEVRAARRPSAATSTSCAPTAPPARPSEVAATGSAAWREAGTQRLYLQVLDLADLDHLADAHDALADAPGLT